MSAPQQAPNAAAMGGGFMPMLLGLGIGGLFAGGLGGLGSKLPTGQQIGRDIYQGIKGAVGQDITGAVNAVKDKAGQLWQGAKDLGSAAVDTVTNTANQAWQGAKDKVSQAYDRVGQAQLDLQMRDFSQPVTTRDPVTGQVNKPTKAQLQEQMNQVRNKSLPSGFGMFWRSAVPDVTDKYHQDMQNFNNDVNKIKGFQPVGQPKTVIPKR